MTELNEDSASTTASSSGKAILLKNDPLTFGALLLEDLK
jgi:hypothetical protein